MFYVLNFFLWNESVLETLPLPYSDEKTRLTAIAEVEEQRIVLKAMQHVKMLLRSAIYSF